MRKINIRKINDLLESKNIKQLDLAKHISMKESALSSALNEKRPFPMSYIFEVSDFFRINPIELTTLVNENISSIQDDKQLQNKGSK